MLDYNRLAADYARHRAVNPKVLAALIDGAEIGSSSRVLEIGCGTGNYIGAIRQATGAECWGIDPSVEMLATASDRHPDLIVDIGSAEEIPLATGQFDLVYSVDVIHHVDDLPAAFGEAKRALKPGGLICTVTDSIDAIRRRRPLSNYFPETVAVEEARYPAIAYLADLMEQTGFINIETQEVAFGYSLANIQPYQDKAFSCLHLIPHEAFDRGIARMQTDLAHGQISALSLYTLIWGRRVSQ